MTVVKNGKNNTNILNLGWEFWLCRVWLPFGLFIQLTGFFWLPSTHFYKVIVADILLLAALFSLFNRAAWVSVLQSRLMLLIFLYLFYMSAISLLRQNEDPLACAHWSFYIALYLFAIGFRLQLRSQELRLLLFISALICAAAIIYGVSRDIFFQHMWSDAYRFVGYGALYNPLRSGHLLGFFSIIALWLTLTIERPFLRRWTAGAITTICFLGVVFTGSRAPLVAIAIAGFYLVYFSVSKRSRNKMLAVGATVLVGVWIVFWSRLIERGLSYRPQIWLEVIKQWQLHPWFGAGYNAPLVIKLNTIADVFSDTHNIVLAVLYCGGIVGVVFFGAVHITAFLQAFRRRESSEGILAGSLMIYGMATLQFDGGSIIGRPNGFWLLLWFPISLLLYVQRSTVEKVGRKQGG